MLEHSKANCLSIVSSDLVVQWATGLTKTLSWMVKILFCNALLTSKILSVILCIDAIAMSIHNESACATGLYDWSKLIPLILELSFAQWHATTFPCIITVALLNTSSNEWTEEFFPSGRNLIGMGAERGLTFLFLLYWTKRAYLQNYLWGPLNSHQYYLVWEVSLGY